MKSIALLEYNWGILAFRPSHSMESFACQIPARAVKCLRHARAHRFTVISLQRRQHIQRRPQSTTTPSDHQAFPHTGYWADILDASEKRKRTGGDTLSKALKEAQPATH